MGYKTTQDVLEGLCGRELALELVKGKSGKKLVKRLTAQDMALLLTVAARQRDPLVFPGDSDPIWYASEETVCDFVHFKKSSLYDSRNFLVKLGLLRYSKSKRHIDYKEPSRCRTYTNVYQIDLEKLKSIAADSELRNTESELRNTDSELRNTDSKVRITETHTDTTDQKKQTNKQNLSEVNDEYLKLVLNAIADSLGINVSDIIPKVVGDAIRGKFPDSVYNAIRDPKGWFRTATNPVNALVSVLRKLPFQENDPDYRRKFNPTVEQILETVSGDVRCLVNDAIKNTGETSVGFVQQLIPVLSSLLASDDGKDFAVETIDHHKAKSAEDSKNMAFKLLRELRSR